MFQAVPFQNISPGAPAVEPCTYCPIVHAVAGTAVTPAAPAAFAGGVEPAGVHVPGVPAVAPVDGTTTAPPHDWSTFAMQPATPIGHLLDRRRA
jgi:hypothetical protein